MFFDLLIIFLELTEEIFQDNLKVGMDFQSRVCAKLGVFFIVRYIYLVIKIMTYYAIYQ